MSNVLKFPVLKFPDAGARVPRGRSSDGDSFLESRILALFNELDRKIQVVNGNRRLSLKSIFDFLDKFSKFLPGEQMRFLETIDYEQLEVGAAAVEFNLWLDRNYEDVEKRREGRAVFGGILRSLTEVELSSLKGLVSFYDSGAEAQRYALQVILRSGYIDFQYFLDSFNEYVTGVESFSSNAATLHLIRKVVTSRVNLCLDRGDETTSA